MLNHTRMTILIVMALPSVAWAEKGGAQAEVVRHLIFWIGAFAVMYLVSKSVFKEHFHERRTLRRLMREIGPFYPEFDINAVKRWVFRCAPHVWNIYRTNDLGTLDGFITKHFEDRYRESGPKRVGPKGDRLIFEKILKVHPLGIYIVEDGKLPSGIELMLRLEEKVKIVSVIAPTPGQKERFTQVQTFWTLRHKDGRWQLNEVWEAEDDVKDLADRPAVPHVQEWMPVRSENK